LQCFTLPNSLLQYETLNDYRYRLMMLSTSFNNISVLLWRSVLLVEETGESHRPVASH
jgi:hypothetical protein